MCFFWFDICSFYVWVSFVICLLLWFVCSTSMGLIYFVVLHFGWWVIFTTSAWPFFLGWVICIFDLFVVGKSDTLVAVAFHPYSVRVFTLKSTKLRLIRLIQNRHPFQLLFSHRLQHSVVLFQKNFCYNRDRPMFCPTRICYCCKNHYSCLACFDMYIWFLGCFNVLEIDGHWKFQKLDGFVYQDWWIMR